MRHDLSGEKGYFRSKEYWIVDQEDKSVQVFIHQGGKRRVVPTKGKTASILTTGCFLSYGLRSLPSGIASEFSFTAMPRLEDLAAGYSLKLMPSN